MLRKIISLFTIVSFLSIHSVSYKPAFAEQGFDLPAAGQRINLSPSFTPLLIKGLKLHQDNPFKFDFIINKGQENINDAKFKQESLKAVKYFLASLAIPEKDLWVNLSPFEHDSIITPEFGLTEMGRDLLSQDYILKQLTSSLIYPEGETGKKFWAKIYAKAQAKYNRPDIQINTFNKVWIVPEKAVVYENAKDQTAYVVESKLKVMLEADYLSLVKHQISKDANSLGSQIVREIVIPELTKEVNEGKNFANLRQITNALILADWFKRSLKESILAKVYVDQKKVNGVNAADINAKEKIFQKYLQAYKKGVYNYIKEEEDPITHQSIPRKYFSGGYIYQGHIETTDVVPSAQPGDAGVTVRLDKTGDGNKAMTAEEVAHVYDPLKTLVQSQLQKFNEPLLSAEKQRGFGQTFKGEIQRWFNQNRVEILKTISGLQKPAKDKRYERNLIGAPIQTPWGKLALYVHVANPKKGVYQHFHGDNEKGGFAWIVPLNTYFYEMKWRGVQHVGQSIVNLDVTKISTNYKEGTVFYLADEDGPHVMYNPSDHYGAFLEFYILPPEGVKGFDVPVPFIFPGSTLNAVIKEINPGILTFDHIGQAAIQGQWREISSHTASDRIAQYPDSTYVFKVVFGGTVVVPAQELSSKLLEDAAVILQDPNDPRLLLLVDQAMTSKEQTEKTYKTLHQLVLHQLTQFGKPILTADDKRVFAQANQDEVQHWFDQHVQEVQDSIGSLDAPEQGDRYRRNLIGAPFITTQGNVVALFIHYANPGKGVYKHFHGDNTQGGFAWIVPLNTRFQEEKWKGLTHVGKTTVQLKQADVIDRPAGQVFHLVDEDGPHVMFNTSLSEKGAFLELYILPPGGVKGFDIPVPQGTPDAVDHTIIQQVNANRIITYDTFGDAAVKGQWSPVSALDASRLILPNPDTTYVFKVVRGETVVVHPSELSAAFFLNAGLILQDPQDPRLFVVFDQAMNTAIDQAAVASKDLKGGIDYAPLDKSIEIKRDGKGIVLPAKFQNLENIHINGLTPIILNVAPIVDLPLFLGAKKIEQEQKLASI